MLVILISMTAQGCRWHDDFRDRRQPEMVEQPLRPTLNRESVDYVVDDTNQDKDIEDETPLPSIDAVSPIPPVQERL